MRQTLLKEKPKCKFCGKEMFLDDVDYNFKGNQDEYWSCIDNHCNYYIIARIRFGKLWKID